MIVNILGISNHILSILIITWVNLFIQFWLHCYIIYFRIWNILILLISIFEIKEILLLIRQLHVIFRCLSSVEPRWKGQLWRPVIHIYCTLGQSWNTRRWFIIADNNSGPFMVILNNLHWCQICISKNAGVCTLLRVSLWFFMISFQVRGLIRIQFKSLWKLWSL